MNNSYRTRVMMMGAAGRDFHSFNVVYRDDPAGMDIPPGAKLERFLSGPAVR